jgi:SAM-dependent methyltransferase
VGDGSRLPFRDGTFNLVFADNVLEHLDQPELVFTEVARVLKPGGRFLIKTPNAWHYVTVLARLTPHRFHRWINRMRGRHDADTFPTRYLANTRTALGALAANAGLHVASVVAVESRPEYARINPVLYVLGRVYERVVNSADWGELFRVVLLGEFAKPGRASR